MTRLRSQRAVLAEARIPADDTLLEATLTIPLSARGIVVLPHAASAGRFNRSHRFTAEVFEQAGIGALQVDLLTPAEEASFPLEAQGRGDVAKLADRITAVLAWLSNQAETSQLAVGLYTSGRETLAALIATERSARVVALVAKGGVPDFEKDVVTHLTCPTLLLLGPEELARAEELAAEFFGRHLA